jgi:hypothetical protein
VAAQTLLADQRDLYCAGLRAVRLPHALLGSQRKVCGEENYRSLP